MLKDFYYELKEGRWAVTMNCLFFFIWCGNYRRLVCNYCRAFDVLWIYSPTKFSLFHLLTTPESTLHCKGLLLVLFYFCLYMHIHVSINPYIKTYLTWKCMLARANYIWVELCLMKIIAIICSKLLLLQ